MTGQHAEFGSPIGGTLPTWNFLISLLAVMKKDDGKKNGRKRKDMDMFMEPEAA